MKESSDISIQNERDEVINNEIKDIEIDYKDWDALQNFDESAMPVLPADDEIVIKDNDPALIKAVNDVKTKVANEKAMAMNEANKDNKTEISKVEEARRTIAIAKEFQKDLQEGPGKIKKVQTELQTMEKAFPKNVFNPKTKVFQVPQGTKDRKLLKSINNYNKKRQELSLLQQNYNAAKEGVKITTPEELKKANDIINGYNKKLQEEIEVTKFIAEEAGKQEKARYIKKYKEDYKKKLSDDYNREKLDKVSQREELEKKDRTNWENFVKQQKNKGKAPFVQTADQVNVYNNALLDAVNSVKNNSLDEVFKTGAYKKTADDSFDIDRLSDKDLRDSEQAFDRLFMEIEAFYNRHKSSESVLKNTQFITSNIKELTPEEATQLKGKSVEDVVTKILDKNGIKKEEISADKFSQYAKAFYLYAIGRQKVSLKFVPGVYSMGDQGPEKQPAGNDSSHIIETEKVILTNSAEAKPAFTNRENAPRYIRLKASDMKGLYPIKEEPALSVDENKLSELTNKLKNQKVKKANTKQEIKSAAADLKREKQRLDNEREEQRRREEEQRRLEEEQRRLEEERRKAAEKLVPKVDLSERKINSILYDYRSDYGGNAKINLTAISLYADSIHKLISNYPEYAEYLNVLNEKVAAYTEIKESSVVNSTKLIGGINIEYASESGDKFVAEAALNLYATARAIGDTIEKYNRAHEEAGMPNKAYNDICKIINDNFDMMHRSMFSESIKYDSTYLDSYKAFFTTFPYNSFKQENGEYAPDNARYNAMMERLPLIKNLQVRQAFLTSREQIIARINDGFKIDKDIRNLHDDYIKISNSIKNDFSKLKSIDPKADPDISALKAFSKDSNNLFSKNLAGERNGDVVTKEINKKLYLVDHGWPVEDTAFIVEMSRVEKELKAIARGSNNATNAVKKEAQIILDKLKNPLERVRKSIVASEDMRDAMLNTLQEPINRFIELKTSVNKQGSDVIQKLYKQAVNRRIMPSHLGGADHRIVAGHADIEVAENVEPVRQPFKKLALSNEQIKENIDIMVQDMHAVEMVTRGSDAFYYMKQALLRLQTYAQGPMNQIDSNDDKKYNSYDDLAAERQKLTREKIREAIRYTKEYLEHKRVDFERDRNRRNDPGREKREQKRINMAITQLEKLNFLLGAFEDLDKSRAIERINQKIEAESQALANAQNKNDYMKAASRILTLCTQKGDSYFKAFNNESDAEYQQRIDGLGVNDLSRDDIQREINKNPVLKDCILALETNYDKENFKKPTAKNLIRSYNQRLNPNDENVYSMQIEYPVVDDNKKKYSDEAEQYKRTLVSDARQNATNQLKQEKNIARRTM